MFSDGRQIDILQANLMSKNAWDYVTPRTNANCFRKASFFISKRVEIMGDEEIMQTGTMKKRLDHFCICNDCYKCICASFIR